MAIASVGRERCEFAGGEVTGVLAVDVGATSTAAALWSGGPVMPLAFPGGATRMPSSVALAHVGEPLLAGTAAERHGMDDPTTYEAAPKRWIGQGLVPLGASTARDVDAVAALLREVTQQVRRGHPTTTVEQVVLTHPPAWRKRRLGVLREAARLVGLPAPTLLPEPCATAAFFAAAGHPPPVGSTVGVCDLGGSSCDVATVRAAADGFELAHAVPTVSLGGDDLDHALVGHVGRMIEGAAAQDAGEDPSSPDRARHRRELWVAVRAAREALSTTRATSVAVPSAGESLLVTRDEFDAVIGDLVDRLVEHAREGFARAGTPLDGLAAVYLVGGAARSPVVARRFLEGTGITPLTLDDPKLAVCLGAVHHLRGARPARVAAEVPAGATAVMERPVPAGATVVTTLPPAGAPPSSSPGPVPGSTDPTVVTTRPPRPLPHEPGGPPPVPSDPDPGPEPPARPARVTPRVLLGAGAVLVVAVVAIVGFAVLRPGSAPAPAPSTYVSDVTAQQLMATSASCTPAAYLIPTGDGTSGVACPSGGLSQEMYKTDLPGEREVTDALRAALPGLEPSPAPGPPGAPPSSPTDCSSTYRWTGTSSSGSPVALVVRVSRARPFVAATRFVPDQTQSFESVERTPFPVSDLRAYCG